MKRYLDERYNPDIVKTVIERFDARSFMFSDLIS